MSTTNFTNSITLTDAAWFDDTDTAVYNTLSSVSGADTITATGPASMSGYAAGQVFKFVAAGDNTGAATLNITPSGSSALGAKAITKQGTTALAAGDIKSGQIVIVVYDGTRFQLSNMHGTLNAQAVGGTWTAASTWTLPAITLGGTVTSNGQSFSGTIANLGTVTTADINGGTLDGVVIGGASAAAATVTTLTATAAASLTLGTDHKWYAFNDANDAYLTQTASGTGQGIVVNGTRVGFVVGGALITKTDATGFLPQTDNTYNLGGASNGWKELFCDNGTINTSDARRKTAVAPLTTAEVNAAKALSAEIGTFQFLDAVAAKGDSARHHVGMTVQRAIEVMQSFGLDPFRYGFICFDEWAEEADAEGNVTKESGSKYGFRADQLALFIVRGIDARLTAAGL